MTTEERDRRMAMLRAAQPYTSGRQRYALDLVLQANALLSTARGGMAGDLEACETTARPEEMLMHMQEFCTPREADLVQMILNFIKAGSRITGISWHNKVPMKIRICMLPDFPPHLPIHSRCFCSSWAALAVWEAPTI